MLRTQEDMMIKKTSANFTFKKLTTLRHTYSMSNFSLWKETNTNTNTNIPFKIT